MSKIAIELSKNITVFRVSGPVSFEEMVNAVKEFYPFVTRPDIIWDFSVSALAGVTADQLQGLAFIVKEFLPHGRSGKTAIVCPDDETFGQFRQYTFHAELNELPCQYRVYRTFEDSLDWLCPKD
ncbi:STAS domain-containing protein [Pelotalea chapellei]|uniref:STAS/SEC14 domain-containing protein n=1 Tax=Pelotalea chapellei TaxID=44671 RepID=A0ABS5UD68_9BACT|nr:STAS domain-containing protein [Pelotalea chapellei]MBT1073583.1 hypothetical protein [Pelotalea chapellei]